ncbi:RING finger protein 37 [Galendromus occidentalis]|uniref:RING finger protein 37 n=1 Tax=Galendromus occidentalis TaxID=34638 RepID=A0AAJ6QRW9_9ACAR|nr:RING finger protein 37 [Galendromus occidentalis]
MKPTNLLNSSLGTTAYCDKVCVDNHGPENLISEDVVTRQNGVLLEHFIRPPVDIDFIFPCVCDIAYIKLKLAKASRAVQRLQVWTQFPGDSNWSKVTTEFDLEPQLVLRCGNVLPRHLTLTDHQLGSQRSVRSIRGVSKLRITILGMKDCVAVSLMGCEAIGLPSSRVPRDHPIFTKLRSPPSSNSAPTRRTPLSSSKPQIEESAKRRRIEDTAAVPEEFLDPITFSVMTIPVALPSGNAVDQSTLDKHVANENRWGRPASDPFTGVALTSKPIVITELKSRIDHFLSATGSTSGVRLADGRNVTRSDISRLVVERIAGHAGEPRNSRTSTNMENAFAEALSSARRILRGDFDNADSRKCPVCKDSGVNYKRGCGHYLCRSCVSKHAESQCTICGAQSTRSSIIKIHGK